MYIIYVTVEGEWLEHARYEHRYDCVDCLRGMDWGKSVRVVGPQGVWSESLIRKERERATHNT